jgi:hypothetical protein
MAGERHGRGMLCVNRPLAARHGRETAWARHGNGMLCESAYKVYTSVRWAQLRTIYLQKRDCSRKPKIFMKRSTGIIWINPDMWWPCVDLCSASHQPWQIIFIYISNNKSGIIIGSRVSIGGTRWRTWLQHCATRQKVAGSIPDVALEFFIDMILPACTMALGSIQPLTEMSTRDVSWG